MVGESQFLKNFNALFSLNLPSPLGDVLDLMLLQDLSMIRLTAL